MARAGAGGGNDSISGLVIILFPLKGLYHPPGDWGDQVYTCTHPDTKTSSAHQPRPSSLIEAPFSSASASLAGSMGPGSLVSPFMSPLPPLPAHIWSPGGLGGGLGACLGPLGGAGAPSYK